MIVVCRGRTVEVEDLESGWAVREGDREVMAHHLDAALTELLEIDVAGVLAVMRLVAQMQRRRRA